MGGKVLAGNYDTKTDRYFYERLMFEAVKYLKVRHELWTKMTGDPVLGKEPEELDAKERDFARVWGDALLMRCGDNPETYVAALRLAAAVENIPTNCFETDVVWKKGGGLKK
jgi:hypothetical protein